MPGRNFVSSPSYMFAYQGQEKETETGFLNFELRQYDPRIGRWFNPDPMQQYHSPYLAMGNNPISMIDPTGGYSAAGAWDQGFDNAVDQQWHDWNVQDNFDPAHDAQVNRQNSYDDYNAALHQYWDAKENNYISSGTRYDASKDNENLPEPIRPGRAIRGGGDPIPKERTADFLLQFNPDAYYQTEEGTLYGNGTLYHIIPSGGTWQGNWNGKKDAYYFINENNRVGGSLRTFPSVPGTLQTAQSDPLPGASNIGAVLNLNFIPGTANLAGPADAAILNNIVRLIQRQGINTVTVSFRTNNPDQFDPNSPAIDLQLNRFNTIATFLWNRTNGTPYSIYYNPGGNQYNQAPGTMGGRVNQSLFFIQNFNIRRP